ncbi:SIS domain-containing protein [Lactobacillus sp. ESL0684]|uniref:SIS domain-containing protein n=1 Tax=Lactobacillus sp. ESL0684 TaxID=2983213 RepID=UPI0023F74AD3|nr:SIS domain-containing protein [Lactobacillus sp. ESL0684]WEV43168.1 SIS domain-containing protein [Lactobacillus sp. ESL0684]
MYFNRTEFINNYDQAVDQLDYVAQVSTEIKKLEIKKIFFTGCGGAFTKFVDLRPTMFKQLNIPFTIVSPEELVDVYLTDLDEHTLVVSGTKTGTTTELLKSLNTIKDKSPKTIQLGFIGDANSELEKMGILDYQFNSVDTDANLIELGWFLEVYSGAAQVQDTVVAQKQLSDLSQHLADKIEALVPKSVKKVNETDLSEMQMWVSSGYAWGEACCFANYISEEIERIKSQSVHAGEYFHGPFEITDQNQCVNVVVNSGTTRDIDLRVVDFAKKFAKDCFVIDLKDFELTDLADNLKSFVEPYVLNHYFDVLLNIYATRTGRTSATRRYYRLMNY